MCFRSVSAGADSGRGAAGGTESLMGEKSGDAREDSMFTNRGFDGNGNDIEASDE